MIIQIILTKIIALLVWLLGLLPVVSLPSGMINGFGTVFDLIGTVGYFLPLGTFVTCVLTMLAFYNLKVLIDIAHWFISKIPGVSR